ETMEDIITNGALVPQTDHRKALCRQRLMPQTPECLAGFGGTLLNRSILGITLYTSAIVHAHLIDMFGKGPPFVCDLLQAYECGRCCMFPCLHFLKFQTPVIA